MMIIPILLIGIVLYIIYNQMKKNIKDNGFNDNSLDILNERYYRGEITEKQYNAKKNIILKRKL
jgi:putative membrane protein